MVVYGSTTAWLTGNFGQTVKLHTHSWIEKFMNDLITEKKEKKKEGSKIMGNQKIMVSRTKATEQFPTICDFRIKRRCLNISVFM